MTSDLGNSGTATDDIFVDASTLGFSKSFSPDTISIAGTSTLTFVIDNPAPDGLFTISFTDTLPTGVLVATPANAMTDCTGGMVTAPDGGSDISFSMPFLAGMTTCSVSVDVTSSTLGTHINTSGDLLSELGSNGRATAALTVVAAPPVPTFAKNFVPDSIAAGGVTTLFFFIDNSGSLLPADSLDFTDALPAGVVVANPANVTTLFFFIDNSGSLLPADSLDFTDALPAGVVVANPANVIISGCMGGTLSAVAGSGTISYTGGSLSAGASCTIEVAVTSIQANTYLNTSGDLTSSLGNSGTAADTLFVTGAPPLPTFSKAFTPSTIPLGGISSLAFTIDNSANLVDATLLDFTDNLPAGMSIANPANPAIVGCVGGILTAASGSSVISYTGGTLAAGATCTISVDVVADITGLNSSDDLTSNLGNSGNASATLQVTSDGAPLNIPTLNVWGLGALAILLLLASLRLFRHP